MRGIGGLPGTNGKDFSGDFGPHHAGNGGMKCLAELLKINPQVKVVVASGYSDIGPMKETMEAGAKNLSASPMK